jgi:hypothetical protein
MKEDPPMLTDMIDMLSSPTRYVCVYRDGEIFIEPSQG